MSKRNNISYIKPKDPSFLAKIKAQIGYNEGPTVDTKRQKYAHEEEDEAAGSDSGSEERRPEREDEKPQVVVLQSGDLTAEEVAQEEARLAREAAEAPADLSQPIVFKKRQKSAKDSSTTAKEDKSSKPIEKKHKHKKAKAQQSKLSFNTEEDEEESN